MIEKLNHDWEYGNRELGNKINEIIEHLNQQPIKEERCPLPYYPCTLPHYPVPLHYHNANPCYRNPCLWA